MPSLKKQTKACKTKELHYHLCPLCYRATPAQAKESFCPNDGTRLLTACQTCGSSIASPYSRFCSACGKSLSS
jgi:hypothetical protein